MLLSESSAEVVKATAGVVAANAVTITSRFYPKMFAAHPELLRVFNHADQELGEQAQALAASVVAYAVQLIDPDAPPFEPVLERIAQKHVSLGIKPSEYTIVGKYLMEAIGEVLGDAVTPEIAAAWNEVYWLFALQLVSAEAMLYREHNVTAETARKEFEVIQRIDEAEDVVSLVLRPVDGGPLFTHSPGQYVTVWADLPDGSRQPRQYTLSTGPRPATRQITVRRVRATDTAPAGLVSNFLHDHCPVGTRLELSFPAGDVLVDQSSDPLVLISAGVGVTTSAAILDDIMRTQPQREVIIAHADRSPSAHALYGVTSAAATRLASTRTHLWYESGADEDDARARSAASGLMDLTAVDIPANAQAFMCGPLPFMREARKTLLAKGIPADHITYEVFGPDLWAQNPDNAEPQPA